MTPPIVLIHGLWLTPRSWEGWKERFEQRGHEVDIDVAARSYVDDILRHKPDEQAVLELDSPTPAEPI